MCLRAFVSHAVPHAGVRASSAGLCHCTTDTARLRTAKSAEGRIGKERVSLRVVQQRQVTPELTKDMNKIRVQRRREEIVSRVSGHLQWKTTHSELAMYVESSKVTLCGLMIIVRDTEKANHETWRISPCCNR